MQEKTNPKTKKTLLILQYFEKKCSSTDDSWHTGAGSSASYIPAVLHSLPDTWAWNEDTVLLTVLYTVLYGKGRRSITTCRGCMHVMMHTRHVN